MSGAASVVTKAQLPDADTVADAVGVVVAGATDVEGVPDAVGTFVVVVVPEIAGVGGPVPELPKMPATAAFCDAVGAGVDEQATSTPAARTHPVAAINCRLTAVQSS